MLILNRFQISRLIVRISRITGRIDLTILRGGHCLFEGRHPKQNYIHQVLPQPSLTALAGLQPPVFKVSKDSILLLQLLLRLALSWIIFSCPDTITPITVAKTLIIANPGCFPWTSQAKIYKPQQKIPPLTTPLLWSVTAPSFLAYSHSSGCLFCSGYPKPG